MSVEDWDGAPFQVVVTQVSGERDVYTFEAKRRSVLKEEMLRVLDADVDSFPSVWERACKALEARSSRVGLSQIGRALPSQLT